MEHGTERPRAKPHLSALHGTGAPLILSMWTCPNPDPRPRRSALTSGAPTSPSMRPSSTQPNVRRSQLTIRNPIPIPVSIRNPNPDRIVGGVSLTTDSRELCQSRCHGASDDGPGPCQPCPRHVVYTTYRHPYYHLSFCMDCMCRTKAAHSPPRFTPSPPCDIRSGIRYVILRRANTQLGTALHGWRLNLHKASKSRGHSTKACSSIKRVCALAGMLERGGD